MYDDLLVKGLAGAGILAALGLFFVKLLVERWLRGIDTTFAAHSTRMDSFERMTAERSDAWHNRINQMHSDVGRLSNRQDSLERDVSRVMDEVKSVGKDVMKRMDDLAGIVHELDKTAGILGDQVKRLANGKGLA